MAYYDNFYYHEHPRWAQKLLIYLNRQLLTFIFSQYPVLGRKLRLLEVGPGKGYFYQAIKMYGNRVEYFCCDQNQVVLDHLPRDHVFRATVPPLPDMSVKFDIIFSAYLIEHLRSGREVYDFVASCRERLTENGLLVLLAPDCLAQKFEFWNMDYTHLYPTTMRNIFMILRENTFSRISIYAINGLLTLRGFQYMWVYIMVRACFFWYNHRIFQFMFGWVFRKKMYDTDNPFYQFFCLAQQKNLMFVAHKGDFYGK